MTEASPGPLPAFDLSAEQQATLDAAADYARRELYPLAARMDAEEWWPAAAFAALGTAGYLGVTVPERLGGGGADLFSSGLVLQALARWNHALGLAWVAHDNLCVNNIYRNASEELRRQYLPGLCSGQLVGALGLTEPGAGSDALGSMRTSARRQGDHYLLNGTKIYITNGPVADVLLVYAKTAPERGPQGISAFIVQKDFEGFRVAQKLDQDGISRQPDRRTGVHRLPRTGGESRRRGERRCRGGDERAGSGARDDRPAVPRDCRARFAAGGWTTPSPASSSGIRSPTSR